MTDWRSNVQITRKDGLKAAGAILGLLFALIFVGWIVMRFVRHEPPPPLQTPVPAVPIPKPAQ